jgi:tetratricopeptide (TPR) repeat protein
VATILNNLAMLLRDRGDLADAEPLSRHALAIDEKALGPNHPSVTTDLDHLAMLLWDKGDPAAAEPLLRRALAIDEKALGPNHPSTRRVRKDLTDLQHNAATAHQ